MAGITHTKVSIIADDPNYDIMPSDWNAEHTLAATIPNVATTAANDFIVGNGSVWQKKTLAETQALILAGGWVPVADTWTYASATTITVPSGAAAIYSVGDKIKLTANSVVLYASIVTVADTLLTVAGNALTNHTFSSCYYSKAVSPVGFPQYFSVVPSMAVANFDNGSGGQATVVKAFITIVGRRLHGRISASGTKAGTDTNLFVIAATQFGPILAANYSGVTVIGIYSRAGVDFGTVSYVAATGNLVSTGASIADNTVIADASMDFSFEI